MNKLRYKVLLSLGTFLVCFLVLEAGFRLFSGSYYLSALVRPSEIPGLGYELVPGARANHPLGGAASVNRWGFKGDDYPKEKPASEFRIVFLGDSVVYGEAAGTRELTRVEQERLTAAPPLPGRTFRTINTAVPSYGTCQELAMLTGRADAFSPDLVVVGYVVNDPEGVRVPFGLDLKTGALPLRYRLYHELKRRSYLLQWLINTAAPAITRLRNRTDYGPGTALQRESFVKYVQTLHDPKGPWWPRCAECLAGLAAYQKEKKVPVVVMVFPLWSSLGDPAMTAVVRRVAKTAERDGLSVLDMTGAFPTGADPKALTVDGMHMTAEGHRLAAAFLDAYLRRRPELFSGRR